MDFGYGSLLWKQNFPYTARRPGVLRGYKRRFWQASADHRGVPGHPGRVTNLLPDSDAQTWGHLFHITGEHADRIGRQLDHREKGGYTRHRVTVETFHGPIHDVITYIGAPDSPYNLGPAPLEQMAWRIATAQGPQRHQLGLPLAPGLLPAPPQDPRPARLRP